MPTQPKNAEQPTSNRRGFGNDGATNLDVIDLVLEIGAIRLSLGACQPHDERRLVDSRSGRRGESQNYSRAAGDCLGGADLGKRRSSIGTEHECCKSEAVSIATDRKADRRNVIDTHRREHWNIDIQLVCPGAVDAERSEVGSWITNSHVQRYTRLG